MKNRAGKKCGKQYHFNKKSTFKFMESHDKKYPTQVKKNDFVSKMVEIKLSSGK